MEQLLASKKVNFVAIDLVMFNKQFSLEQVISVCLLFFFKKKAKQKEAMPLMVEVSNRRDLPQLVWVFIIICRSRNRIV